MAHGAELKPAYVEHFSMLTLSEDALAMIAEHKQPVFIDVPRSVEGCCLEITPCPSVRFGTPRNSEQHTLTRIQGAEVFVPHDLPRTLNLSIRARKLFGLKFLFIGGWKLV